MTGPFRFTSPVPVPSATGAVADAYAQQEAEFGIRAPAPFAALSPSAPLFTAAWVLMRESLLAGIASRTEKELVATGVSLANACGFCVGAHTMLLLAGGERELAARLAWGDEPEDPAHAALLDWGRHGGPAPFPADLAPEFIGTALTFHFVNRIASVLVHEPAMADARQRDRLLASPAGRHLTETIRRVPPSGEGLRLLQTRGVEPPWAWGTPIGTAYGALRDAALMGKGLLSGDEQAFLEGVLAEWDGVPHPPELPEAPSPGARLAMLAALAPNRVTDRDVTDWLVPPYSDHCLVHLVAYGAWLAVERVESALLGTRAAGHGTR